MDVETFEARYLESAAQVVAARAEVVTVVLPNRLPSLAGNGTALVGWWVDEAAAGNRIVLPNPYGSVEAITTMEAWVWSVVQRLAPRLGQTLDEIARRPARGSEYWRVLLSPWLVHLLSALADRRLFCRAVTELAAGIPLAVPAVPDPPSTAADALLRLRTDEGNAGLLAVLAPLLAVPTTPAATSVAPTPLVNRPPQLAALRAMATAGVRGSIGAALASLPRRRLGLVGQLSLNPLDLLRLEARVRGVAPLPRPCIGRSAAPTDADPEARARLASDDARDPLERLALQAMPWLLPLSLLEDYDELRREARRAYGSPTDVLVGSYSIDERQNEFLARCRAAGRRFAFVQHGGMYLQSPVNSQERLEIAPGSTFFSWEDAAPASCRCPIHLERLRDSHRGGTRITLVEGLQPPDAYVLRFAGHPQANQGYESTRMLADMVERVSPQRWTHLALRRFPSPVGTPARPPSLKRLPWHGPRGGATAWMATSRLVVIPYFDTPFIEAIVIGTPTVGLWNPEHWPLLDEVAPLFERLQAMSVLHGDPASAAAHIDAVYDDVAAWWELPEVLACRAEFLARFAMAGHWLDAWTRHLREPPS